MINIYDNIDSNIINDHYMNRYISFISNLYDKHRNLDLKEHHHIIPVSINKELKFNNDNIIILTPREHYIAHLILTKCFINEYKYKMYYALNFICYGKSSSNKRDFKLNSRQYDHAKKLNSIATKNRFTKLPRNF